VSSGGLVLFSTRERDAAIIKANQGTNDVDGCMVGDESSRVLLKAAGITLIVGSFAIVCARLHLIQ